jgi:hypothetical protein
VGTAGRGRSSVRVILEYLSEGRLKSSRGGGSVAGECFNPKIDLSRSHREEVDDSFDPV